MQNVHTIPEEEVSFKNFRRRATSIIRHFLNGDTVGTCDVLVFLALKIVRQFFKFGQFFEI